MNTHKLTKEERMKLVLRGDLSEDYLTFEEVVELKALVMDAVAYKLNYQTAKRTIQ
jgi:hypothetical protein